jgi:hypothetical protein
VKLEYLPDGSPDCPLIRLYEFTTTEVQTLLTAVQALAEGSAEKIAVHELPGVEPVDGCRLTLRVNKWDQAVLRIANPAEFECAFRPITWDNVAGLIEPFVDGHRGFQWLADVPGEAQVLLSYDGKW